jgi:hypothetical protein
MKRFWIFRAIGCVSLLMTLVALAQSPRDSADGGFILTPDGRLFIMAWHRGTCVLYHRNLRTNSLPHESTFMQTFSVDPQRFAFQAYPPSSTTVNLGAARMNLGWHAPEWGESNWSSFVVVVVPLWTWLVMATPLPAVGIVRHLRTRRRRALGLCQVCGYDLRASPTRCPECGTEVQARP